MSDGNEHERSTSESSISTVKSRIKQVDNVRERGIAVLITAVVVAGLIFSGSPASAVSTSVSGPSEVDLADGDDTINLTYEVDIEDGERIPAEGVRIDIAEEDGSDSATLITDLSTGTTKAAGGDDGGAIDNNALDPNVTIRGNYPLDPGYGYGYGNRTGTEYGYGYSSESGYGYGYGSSEIAFGYGYGYSQNSRLANDATEFTVTVEVDEDAFEPGPDGKDYAVDGSVVTNTSDGYSVFDLNQITTNFAASGEDNGLTLEVTDTSDDGSDPDDDDDGSDGSDGGGGGSSSGGGGDAQLSERSITDVRPGANGTTVAFPGNDLAEITFATENASGTVTIEEFETLPSSAPPLAEDRPVVGVVDISVPDDLANTSATIVIELPVERFEEVGLAPEEAVVLRGTDGGYETLSTGIEVDDGVVSLTAETDGFSPFVVTNAQQTATPTDEVTPTPTDDDPAEPTATPTDEPGDETASPTSAEQPGFGIIVGIAALLSLALLARRRAAE
jgi:PGF-CTERM protein